MRLSKSKQYRVSAYTADRVFITSRFGEFSTLKQCRLTASQLAREQRQMLGFFSVYCVNDDSYQMYDYNGRKL